MKLSEWIRKYINSRWGTLANEVAQLERELATSMAYADKLAAGLPDGILPKDVEVLRKANSYFAEENAALKRFRQDVYNAYTPNKHCNIVKLENILKKALLTTEESE